MMKIELTDDEWTTVLVALDHYRAHKTAMAAELYDRQLTEDAGSAEWCWQKIWGEIARDRNAIADAVGEGEQPELPFDGARDVVDPFDFVGLDPSRVSNYDNMGDK
jgi:hypothetical protein